MNLNHCPRQREHDSEWLENRPRGINHCTPNGRENTRVLLTTQNVLLGDVLEILLTDELIPVHRIMCTQPDSLWQGVEQHQPQVIVLEEGLFDEVYLARLAQRQGRGRRRIILVHPQKNRVRIYGKRPLSLTQAADFIALMKNGYLELEERARGNQSGEPSRSSSER